MKTSEELKNVVKEKYGEIAVSSLHNQDAAVQLLHVVVIHPMWNL